jgi:DNA helicase-2/ATP-dependent DNA helicase PcrA
MLDSVDGLSLDEEQRTAVRSTQRAIAVLAGPGSGKTRVLSYRARHLLGASSDSRALLLTFTNKAAAEMKSRAMAAAVVTSDRIWAGTFHTFGMRVLRAHGELTGIGREFDVLDEDEQSQLITEATSKAGVTDRYKRWSYLRLRLETTRESEVVRFGYAYENAKSSRQVVDFDDLVVRTAQLFAEHSEIADAYATQYPHLLVDEFQDTNAAQFAVIRALARRSLTVSVFADDDQAIYRFAGAEAENVRRFITELGAREYPLTINYRCRQAIVDRANRLIAADPAASGRQMRAFHANGEARCLVFGTTTEEAIGLANEISGLVGSQGIQPHSIAVLTRSAFRVREALAEIIGRGIPVSNWLGPSHEPQERRTLRTCLSVVRGKLSDHQAARLCELLSITKSSERDPAVLLENNSQIAAASLLLQLRELAWAGSPVHEVVKAAQIAAAAIDVGLGKAMEPMVNTVLAFEEFDSDFTLEHLLAELALGGVGGPPTVGGGIKIATLHRTKGLQWPHVYIVGLEEGKLPNYYADTVEEIREERRACFVGVCRAEQRLTLTRSRRYGPYVQSPSRFLNDMGFA